MTTRRSAARDIRAGPESYENWLAAIRGDPATYAYEVELFTDAYLTGEVSSGLEPYAFLNLVPLPFAIDRARAAAVLRVNVHLEVDESVDMSRTDATRYHGGALADEIAALASLRLGVRVKAGGVTREFEPAKDPRGRPVGARYRAAPVIPIAGVFGPTLSMVREERSLNLLEDLASFPNLSAAQAVAAIRAARLYQDAIWIAESEPNLGWLMLVSAVESAANEWRRQKGTPVERLRAERPEFVQETERLSGPAMVEFIADTFSDAIGATKAFCDFLLSYMPEPPTRRPPVSARVQWEPEALRPAFSKIYGYRSKALHEGIPFPAPMCIQGWRDPSWEAPAEKPMGLAASTFGGVWMAKDTPMMLATFEYIARNTILRWLGTLTVGKVEGQG